MDKTTINLDGISYNFIITNPELGWYKTEVQNNDGEVIIDNDVLYPSFESASTDGLEECKLMWEDDCETLIYERNPNTLVQLLIVHNIPVASCVDGTFYVDAYALHHSSAYKQIKRFVGSSPFYSTQRPYFENLLKKRTL